MTMALAGLIFAATLVAIIVRPFRINEAWSAGAGAALMLITGVVSPNAAFVAIGSEWNLFLFFLGLMLTAAVADMAGFFDWAAALAAAAAGGSGRLLLFNVFVLGAVITTFLSNDATAIILTPVVYTIATRLRLRVMPYLFAVSFMANAASMTLPISNPINVLTGDRLHAPLAVYEGHLLPASIASIAITTAVLMAIFWRSAAGHFEFDWRAAVKLAIADRSFFVAVLAGLLVLAVAYVVGSALLWPLGVVAIAGGGGLFALAAARRRLSREDLSAHVSPALFVYIAALFILVRGVEEAGITPALVSSAVGQAGDAGSAVVAGLLGSAAASNLINNLPAVLVFISGAQAGGVQPSLYQPFLFGALAGADLGPNLTPVGALSTMLWLVIVRRRGVEVSAWDFLKLGAIVAPLTLLAAGLLVAASFR
ncbi:MAG TPA: ArsB/NhaD family transporter [Candidatus Dormibacteraeota bacterium]